jgi:hypothetical protein
MASRRALAFRLVHRAPDYREGCDKRLRSERVTVVMDGALELHLPADFREFQPAAKDLNRASG